MPKPKPKLCCFDVAFNVACFACVAFGFSDSVGEAFTFNACFAVMFYNKYCILLAYVRRAGVCLLQNSPAGQ